MSEQHTERDVNAALNGAKAGRDKEPFGSNGGGGAREDEELGTGVRVYPEPMDRNAYFGVLGKIAREIEPYIKADPAALFFNLVTKAGIAIGRKPYLQRGTHYHRGNLGVVTVGVTSDGKSDGTSPPERMDEAVLALLEEAERATRKRQTGTTVDTSHADDPHYVPPSPWEIVPQLSGLSSGEGLLHAIRDERVTRKLNKKSGQIERQVEPGVADKRLLIVESELAHVFAVMAREGNTLGTLLRNLYDSKRTAESNPKSEPIRVTEPHVGLIAAITPDELHYCLHGVELSNGLVNRYLWPLTKCVKDLADPEDYREKAKEHAQKWILALRRAKPIERVTFNTEALALWKEQYRLLRRGGRPGMQPRGEGRGRDVCSRGHVAAMRMALIFAVMAGSKVITKPMLEAALLAWDYCERCAMYLFSDMPKHLIETTILDALKARGKMSRNDIMNLFSRNSSSASIQIALTALLTAKQVKTWKESTGGRPLEWWEAL
jgi:hypothetical protein